MGVLRCVALLAILCPCGFSVSLPRHFPPHGGAPDLPGDVITSRQWLQTTSVFVFRHLPAWRKLPPEFELESVHLRPNQMESGVLGYYFRSKNGSIG
jgi:hypothetical protein